MEEEFGDLSAFIEREKDSMLKMGEKQTFPVSPSSAIPEVTRTPKSQLLPVITTGPSDTPYTSDGKEEEDGIWREMSQISEHGNLDSPDHSEKEMEEMVIELKGITTDCQILSVNMEKELNLYAWEMNF